MRAPVMLVFTEDRARVLQEAQGFRVVFAPPYMPGSDLYVIESGQVVEPLYALAVGPEGGAALARWLQQHGLDGVAGVGLVGVTAPWAERRLFCLAPGHSTMRLPLGPLEPLRAVAERARVGTSCECTAHGGPDHRDAGPCASGTIYPLRLVVASAPDDGVCPLLGCGARGWHLAPPYNVIGIEHRKHCAACSGTGKALSSADVARELGGPYPSPDLRLSEGFPGTVLRWGGLTLILYKTSAALTEHGLRAVVERLTR